MGEIRIGISGWTYPPWRNTFYPEDLSIKKELEYASQCVSTIEVNGTFYRLQKPHTFRSWYERTPKGFVFSIKGSRYITHIKRLKDVRAALSSFFASGPLELNEKLGPILWQFPPNMKFNEERFREFFSLLPKNVSQAVALAKEDDPTIKIKAQPKTRLRYAVEIRNDSFRSEIFINLLREFGIAYVIADTAGRWVYAEDLTADFVYVRLHGFKEIYSGGYTDKAIRDWSNKIRAWQKGKPASKAKTIAPHKITSKNKDIFVYFDNDAKVNAPFDATALTLKLQKTQGLKLPETDPRILLKAKKKVSKLALKSLQARARSRPRE